MNQTRQAFPGPAHYCTGHPKVYHCWGRQRVASFGKVPASAETPGRGPTQPSSHGSGQGAGVSPRSSSKGNDEPTAGTLENTEMTRDGAPSILCAQAKLVVRSGSSICPLFPSLPSLIPQLFSIFF
ncbi:hypothetical protein HJG60_009285 [Phyllostomus discolor]|uniref:Uncharacterized protein n=1 Tax=Phyllostomus discolor TaxID=89673 RepID=A0A833YKB9_9CHIR|nr:hypothetical protein HJG60_009285 [Phyllostomus discolor]